MTSRPDHRRTRIAGRLAALLVVPVLVLAACGSDGGSSDGSKATGGSGQLEGTVRTPALQVGDITLPQVSTSKPDVPFTFKAKQGKLLFVAFGYTNCPDVCPTTPSDMKKAKAKLGADGDKVDMAFVTIDPERDTPDVIVPYLGSFAKSGGHPIRTTDADALAKAKDAFDVKSSVTKKPDGEVEVTHSARSFIVDDTGKVVVEWNFGTGSDGMAHDLAILLDRA